MVMPWFPKRWIAVVGLGVVLASAVLLRLPGFDRPPQLDFGPLYQDELKMFTNTIKVMNDRPLLPHWPYGIYRVMEPQFQALRWFYTLECERSLIDPISIGDLRLIAEAELDRVIVMIRAHAMFFGLGIIILTFVIGRRIGAVPGGLAAALIVAVAPLMVSYSRMMYYDIVMVFFFLLYVLVFSKALRERSVAYVYVAVGLSAIAFTMKQNAVVLFVADLWLVSAIIADRRPWRLLYSRHSLWLALMTLAILWYGYPTMFTVDGFRGFADSVSSKYYGAAVAEPTHLEDRLWWVWIRSVWIDQGPPIVLLVLLVGLVIALAVGQDRYMAASVFGTGVIYYLIGGYSTHAIDRTFMPLVPLFALGVAGWVALLSHIPAPHLRFTAMAILLLFAVVPLLTNTVRTNLLLTLPDTRSEIARWFDSEAANESTVARETYAPHLPQLPDVECPAGVASIIGSGKHFEVTYRNSLASEAPEWYSQQGIRYLIHVQANYDRLLRQQTEGFVESPTDTSARRMGKTLRYGVPIADAIARYDALAKNYRVAARSDVEPPPDWLMRRCAVYRASQEPSVPGFPAVRRCAQPSFSSFDGVAKFLLTGWFDADVLRLWKHHNEYVLGRNAVIYDTGAQPHTE
jgi:hypothetical protein